MHIIKDSGCAFYQAECARRYPRALSNIFCMVSILFCFSEIILESILLLMLDRHDQTGYIHPSTNITYSTFQENFYFSVMILGASCSVLIFEIAVLVAINARKHSARVLSKFQRCCYTTVALFAIELVMVAYVWRWIYKDSSCVYVQSFDAWNVEKEMAFHLTICSCNLFMFLLICSHLVVTAVFSCFFKAFIDMVYERQRSMEERERKILSLQRILIRSGSQQRPAATKVQQLSNSVSNQAISVIKVESKELDSRDSKS